MVTAVMTTTDGKIRVYLYEDQTAEVSDERGVLLHGRAPLYKIGRILADEYGVTSSDLVRA